MIARVFYTHLYQMQPPENMVVPRAAECEQTEPNHCSLAYAKYPILIPQERRSPTSVNRESTYTEGTLKAPTYFSRGPFQLRMGSSPPHALSWREPLCTCSLLTAEAAGGEEAGGGGLRDRRETAALSYTKPHEGRASMCTEAPAHGC